MSGDTKEAVRSAIIDPQSFSVDHLLRLNDVQALSKSDPILFKALKLVAEGNLPEYVAFVKENPKFVVDQLKFEEESLEKKMKMLTLISLAEASSVLQLDKLAKELNIASGEELEEFLIEAIRIKAVNGKIHEHSNEFVVTSFQHRNFGRPQWELLQKRLSALVKNFRKASSNMDVMFESFH